MLEVVNNCSIIQKEKAGRCALVRHTDRRRSKTVVCSGSDGTSYFPFGTTCYAWVHQGDALEEQTLETLKTAGFNKLRMCVFPKDYIFNKNEPEHYPFDKDADDNWDLTRYNLAFFRHFEKRVAQLGGCDRHLGDDSGNTGRHF